jgi:glycogen operon protein
VLNAAPDDIAFQLPKLPEYTSWRQLLNTADDSEPPAEFSSGSETSAAARSVLVFAGRE